MQNRAFTLLEVLVALVVFSIAALGVYGLLNQSLFVQNYSDEKLDLILASTEYIYTNISSIPDETAGWKEIDSASIDAYRITRIPIGFYNIYKISWDFKKGNVIIGYVIYR